MIEFRLYYYRLSQGIVAFYQLLLLFCGAAAIDSSTAIAAFLEVLGQIKVPNKTVALTDHGQRRSWIAHEIRDSLLEG